MKLENLDGALDKAEKQLCDKLASSKLAGWIPAAFLGLVVVQALVNISLALERIADRLDGKSGD